MLIGQHLGGKYEIQAEIGRGGMGIVYRGFDVMLQRAVAVKVLPREFTYDPQFVQRFRQEAVMAAGLHHPGIVTIHDVGEQDGTHYIVMQLLEGATLDSPLVSHGPMPLPQANHIIRQVAEALDYAHGRGIVHRDIKPSNIMIGPGGQATVMDFGLVRAGEGIGDPYEPNGAAAQAWGPLPLNRDFLGYFNCAADTEFDFYFFELTTGGQVVVTLRDIPLGSDYNLALYNCREATADCRIGYSGNTGNANESITVTTNAGRHIVRINRRPTDPLVSQPYVLRVATP